MIWQCFRSPLHAAAFSDQCEPMQLLISHGASVNYCDKTGKSSIMLASANGHVAAVELLLENGADLSFADCDKNTALHFACSHVSTINCTCIQVLKNNF